jgi:hypothetical protein
MEEKRKAYRLLVGTLEGKRSLGRPRRSWLNDMSIDLGEVGWGEVYWIGLAQDRRGGEVESYCEFGIEPSGSMKCWETFELPSI